MRLAEIGAPERPAQLLPAGSCHSRRSHTSPARVCDTLILIALVLVLGPLSWWVGGVTVKDLAGPDRANAINSVRQTVLAAFGRVAVVAGFIVSGRT